MSTFSVWSGGQTGADRGGLDAAIELDVPHEGWCPKGRRAEDGPIPAQYVLRECDSEDYRVRTELNVAATDGTIIFTHGILSSGSFLTSNFCKKHKKPYLWLDLEVIRRNKDNNVISSYEAIIEFVWQNSIDKLNIAGNRESKSPGIQQNVKRVMTQVLGRVA